MKLIVGLGNPGKEYENTRHNIGFMVIDKIAEKYNLNIKDKKFNGLYETTIINNEKIVFLKPQSYINLSGEVIRKFIDFFNIDIQDILIINDDLDLNIGSYKIKKKGSSGGHNGLKNIELHLNTQEYKRIKVGIANDKTLNTRDYVLGKFNKDDSIIIDKTIDVVVDIVLDSLSMDFEELMNKYNGNMI